MLVMAPQVELVRGEIDTRVGVNLMNVLWQCIRMVLGRASVYAMLQCMLELACNAVWDTSTYLAVANVPCCNLCCAVPFPA